MVIPRRRLLVVLVRDDAHQTLKRRLRESSVSWMYAPDLDRGEVAGIESRAQDRRGKVNRYSKTFTRSLEKYANNLQITAPELFQHL